MRTDKTDYEVLLELMKNKKVYGVEFKRKGVLENQDKRIHMFNVDISFMEEK